MPIYLYRCEQCGKEKEEIRKVDDRNNNFPECDHCHGRMMPAIAQVQPPKFKGSGFYETDYGKSKKKKTT